MRVGSLMNSRLSQLITSADLRMSKSWCFHWILALELVGLMLALGSPVICGLSRGWKSLTKEFYKMSWPCRWCLSGDWTNYKVCSGRPQCMHLCLWPNWNRQNLHNGKSQLLNSIFNYPSPNEDFPWSSNPNIWRVVGERWMPYLCSGLWCLWMSWL